MIREATEDDVFDVLILAKQFSKQAPALYKWDKDKAEQWILSAIRNDNMLFLVFEDDGDIEAGLMAINSELFMSERVVSTVFGWFVSKEARNKLGPYRLLDKAEQWAKDNNVSTLVVADLPEMKDLKKFYTRKGFTLTERSYSKEL